MGEVLDTFGRMMMRHPILSTLLLGAVPPLLVAAVTASYAEEIKEEERVIANMAYLAPYVTPTGGHDKIVVLSPIKAARVMSNGISKMVKETERCIFEIESAGDTSYRIDLRRLTGDIRQRCGSVGCSYVVSGLGDVTCTLKSGKVQSWCLPEIQFIGNSKTALAALSFVAETHCPPIGRLPPSPPY